MTKILKLEEIDFRLKLMNLLLIGKGYMDNVEVQQVMYWPAMYLWGGSFHGCDACCINLARFGS